MKHSAKALLRRTAGRLQRHGHSAGRLLRRGEAVLAYLNVEGRTVRGVVLDTLKGGVWIQIRDFPAPILFPYSCVRAA